MNSTQFFLWWCGVNRESYREEAARQKERTEDTIVRLQRATVVMDVLLKAA